MASLRASIKNPRKADGFHPPLRSVLYVYDEGVPLVGLEIGIYSAVYNVTKDFLRWALKKMEKEDPAQVVQLRQKWKEEIQNNLRWIDDIVGYGEAIIRDVKRADSYPDVEDKGKGISPWFRTGLLGVYHRGLQVGLRIEGLKWEEPAGGWRYCDFKSNEQPDLNAYLVGRIPFERIVSIDWEGDEYYGFPHIYCRFANKRKEPYEQIVFCEKRRLDHIVYYSEVTPYEAVRDLSKKLGKGTYA